MYYIECFLEIALKPFLISAYMYQLTGSYATVYQVIAIFPFTASLILILIYVLRKMKCGYVYSDNIVNSVDLVSKE